MKVTKPNSSSYIVAGSKPWNKRVFREQIRLLPGNWTFAGTRDELTAQVVESIEPRYIFFLHWSWKVPAAIHERWECVCFHMADVPHGRGGSPLQNLIVRGHKETKLTALRMVEEMDAGPVYLKEQLSLHGTAESIYVRATELAADMIERIITNEPNPVPQAGSPTIFKRRRPEESEIPPAATLHEAYDFIRMLDAEGYPKAFLTHGGLRFEFSRAVEYDNEIKADVRITRTSQSPADKDNGDDGYGTAN